MKIQTFSIIIGDRKCNAKCPFCVSKMTHKNGIDQTFLNPEEIKTNFYKRFKSACTYAKDCGVSTVLLTGKGEPTIHPNEITNTLGKLEDWNFPFVELQTNGIRFHTMKDEFIEHLSKWCHHGLTTVAISIVHYDDWMNESIYGTHIDLKEVINNLHEIGLSIRLCCMMVDGYIDGVTRIQDLIQYARKLNVEQLTVRPIKKPKICMNQKIAKFIDKHTLSYSQAITIQEHLDSKGTKLLELMHGATVYDYQGQNICISDCLTLEPEKGEEIRQLIFYPDGHIRYDWQYPGAILL